ncbi:MAG: ribosome small subunit-dependent GTPase A [Leptospiraceae bacterium]|nr:ribosome small subunit-dependent GTPase A [Leptospiraceae bacterium]MDW8306607.1 ribosome small subunit-dependent GTPase A [Leptospiraceae bacterium]
MLHRAYVSAGFGAFYWVKFWENIPSMISPVFYDKCGPIYLAKLSGKLRLSLPLPKVKRREHIVAVGDEVLAQITPNFALIEEILPRKNSFCRASHERRQVLAANVDQILLILSFSTPPLNHRFADRILCEATLSFIPVIIAINKKDLFAYLNTRDKEMARALAFLYQSLGYSVLEESFHEKVSLELEKALLGRRTLFLGQSGVGKSTLLNLLAKEEIQKVDQQQIKFKGRHTTVNAILYSLGQETEIIDVPGLREFGLQHRSKEEIRHGFVEFHGLSCRFENCLHMEEPGCAVREAVNQKLISPLRYDSYVDILLSHEESFKPRKGDYRRGLRR